MSVYYYFLTLLQDYKGENDSVLTSPFAVNMPITREDKIPIKNLFMLDGYNVKQLVKEFPQQRLECSSIYKLLQKLQVTGSVNCRPGSGK